MIVGGTSPSRRQLAAGGPPPQVRGSRVRAGYSNLMSEGHGPGGAAGVTGWADRRVTARTATPRRDRPAYARDRRWQLTGSERGVEDGVVAPDGGTRTVFAGQSAPALG